jgi:hypothetical protein
MNELLMVPLRLEVSRTIHHWKSAMMKVRMRHSIPKSHDASYSSILMVLSGWDAMKQRCGGRCAR